MSLKVNTHLYSNDLGITFRIAFRNSFHMNSTVHIFIKFVHCRICV